MIKRRNRFLNISIATFVAVMLSVVGTGVHSASALTYQNEIRTSFTFNSSVSLSLSSPDLIISELANGTYGISNTITLTAASNNSTGYVVTATAGDGTTYTTTDLVNAVDNSAKLGSLDTDASLDIESDAFAPGKWGYTFSNDNGSNWAGYSGLPLIGADGAEIANADQAGVTTTLFKIGAKATNTQQAGEYKNKVNFTVTANPMPVIYMQDLNPVSIASLLPDVGDKTILHDKRDDQAYTVAKLADGKYWMVENLNLAGGTALSADDTDVTSAYISSFSTSNNLTKTGNTIVLPASSTSGFNTDNYSYVYNSGNKTNCGALDQNTPCYSYYSWDAVTLGSGRTIATDNENAPYSICPKGWKLPSTYNGTNSATDFRALMIALGGSASVSTYTSSTTPTGATMYGLIGPGTTPNFLLAGFYNYGSFSKGGSYGYYWSSTSYSSTNYARNLYFNSSYVYSANASNRYYGCSVRCLFGA